MYSKYNSVIASEWKPTYHTCRFYYDPETSFFFPKTLVMWVHDPWVHDPFEDSLILAMTVSLT